MNEQEKAYYHSRIASGQDDAQKVGWKNIEAQRLRFEQFLRLLPAQRDDIFTIQDIGCGIGDLFIFLERFYLNFKYLGYDILPEMIHRAKEKHLSKMESANFCIIEKIDQIGEADYNVASGIFNLKHNIKDEQWLQFIIETLHIMHKKSEVGFAFNALTSYSDLEFRKQELYYSDPLYLFDYCKKNFGKNVALLHDYNQYDFTIVVKKKFDILI